MELLDKPVIVTHSTVAFLLVLTGTTAGFDQREQRELKPLKYCHGHFLLFNNLVFIIQLLHFISGDHLAKNILVFENNVQNLQQNLALSGLGLGGGERYLQQPGPLEHGPDGLGEHRSAAPPAAAAFCCAPPGPAWRGSCGGRGSPAGGGSSQPAPGAIVS